MGRPAVAPSRAIARLLRDQRQRLGWTLRDVEIKSRAPGRSIPFATLAKVEQGRVDPGLPRLHVLLRLYDLPMELAQDVLDLEEFAGELPADVPTATLREEALRHWRGGDLRQAFTHYVGLRARAPKDAAGRLERQKALLSIAVAVGALGKYRLSRHIVEELLLTSPETEILVPVFVQAAVCWHWLGSGEAALGFLSRAEANLSPENHRDGGWIAHERASTLASMGRLEEAEEAVTRAIAEYRAAGETYGESQALGVRARLCFERRDWDGARSAAREARQHAERHGFGRLAVLRALDEGRALFENSEHDAGLAILSSGLAQALAAQDPVAQFYAHHYLWKAYLHAGDVERAEVDLSAARYFVQFIDATVPEAAEVRGVAGVDAGNRRDA